jgi:hypothetical protein
MTTVAPSTAQIATAREVEAKPAESGELVFTSMYVHVLYGLSLLGGRLLNRKKDPPP